MNQASLPSGGGLEILIPTNRILITETKDFSSNPSGCRHYNIFDHEGRRILFLVEEMSRNPKTCCCYFPKTIFDMFDSQETLILSGSHYTKTGCDKPLSTCEVSAFGNTFGGVHEKVDACCCCWNSFYYSIVDGNGTPVLRIGKRSVNKVGNKVSWNFPLMTVDKKPIGKISTFISPADSSVNFEAEFPSGLDVKIKATLIYATITIGYDYSNVTTRKHGTGHHFAAAGAMFF